MIYITNEYKIIVLHIETSSDCILIEIENKTNFLPLCVRKHIILLSNGKLYYIEKNNLCEIKLLTNNDYVVDPDDFTDNFVMIDSEYYEIIDNNLYKIPIIAKNSQCIISTTKPNTYYCYVDPHDNLMLSKIIVTDYYIGGGGTCKKKYAIEYNICVDNNVETILFSCANYRWSKPYLIYKKIDSGILISTINYENAILINSIEYNGSAIIKTIDRFIIDSNCDIFEFNARNTTFKKIINGVDFTTAYTFLFILNDHNDLVLVKNDDYEINKCIAKNCYFKLSPTMANVKSAMIRS